MKTAQSVEVTDCYFDRLRGQRQSEKDPYSVVGVDVEVRRPPHVADVEAAAQAVQPIGEPDRRKAELTAPLEETVRSAARYVVEVTPDGCLQRQLQAPRGIPGEAAGEAVGDVVVVVRKQREVEIARRAEAE